MKRLVLPEGLSRYTVTSDIDVRMVVNQNAETLIEFNAEEDMECTWEIRVLSGVKATVFFLNQARGSVTTKIHVHAEKDAAVKVGVLEFGKAAHTLNAKIDLEGEGAVSEFHTAALADARLSYDIETEHKAGYTEGYMKNYGLVVSEIPWTIVCAGRINRGAKGSKSRQESRILTFGKPENIKVLPILYIDENDVEASHANSIGQPEAEAMYYMESRGLDRKEVIGLLSAGYILPAADLFEDTSMSAYLRNLIQKKVKEWEQ